MKLRRDIRLVITKAPCCGTISIALAIRARWRQRLQRRRPACFPRLDHGHVSML